MDQPLFEDGQGWFMFVGATWLFMLVVSIWVPPRTGNYFDLAHIYRAYRYRAAGTRADGFKHVAFRLVEYFTLGFALIGFGIMIMTSVTR